MTTEKTEAYLSELATALQRRGADSDRTSAAIAEVERHVAEADVDPAQTFGRADVYAEQLLQHVTESDDPDWVIRTFRGTAFDEMDILEDAGQQGWELMDVGAFALHCRRPRDVETALRWEYRRRVSFNQQATRETMTTLGWQPCGTWMPFQYFKRQR